MSLDTYGHVIEELDDGQPVSPEGRTIRRVPMTPFMTVITVEAVDRWSGAPRENDVRPPRQNPLPCLAPTSNHWRQRSAAPRDGRPDFRAEIERA